MITRSDYFYCVKQDFPTSHSGEKIKPLLSGSWEIPQHMNHLSRRDSPSKSPRCYQLRERCLSSCLLLATSVPSITNFGCSDLQISNSYRWMQKAFWIPDGSRDTSKISTDAWERKRILPLKRLYFIEYIHMYTFTIKGTTPVQMAHSFGLFQGRNS